MKIRRNGLPLEVPGTVLLGLLIGCTGSCQATRPVTTETTLAEDPTATATVPGADSGIYGSMVSAWGNPPANPPTYECVKIFDSTGQNVVAKGTCSGVWGQFRVPLPPGRYVMESGGSWETVNGAVRFRPNRREIEVKPGEWGKIAPPSPPGPMP